MTGVEMSESSQVGASPPRLRRPEKNELIISYMFLRKTVGWIGSLLPIILITGNVIFFTTSLPGSMSGYYYTHMRDVFVGALCALGVFLVAYAGYDEVDRWITNIAGLCAIGVAFFPTKPPVCAANARTCTAPWVTHLSAGQQAVGDIHLFFAAVTFIALGLMALRFAKSGRTPSGQARMSRIRHGLGLARPSHDQRSPRKKQRNAVYRACGIVIMSCVGLAAASNLLPTSVKAYCPWLFVFEALAVFAFGISWFVKGQTLHALKDRPAPTVARVCPASGPVAGDTNVTVTGTGFTSVIGVNFGETAAPAPAVSSDTRLTVTSPPAEAPGEVDMTVTTRAGTSATSSASKFTYTSVPATGTGLTGISQVNDGKTAAPAQTGSGDSWS